LRLLLGLFCHVPVEKWVGDPLKSARLSACSTRLILNQGLPIILAFVVWSGIKLFSAFFMGTQLIGSLVFPGRVRLPVQADRVVRKNSWRWPSMN
jgi:hypothetical protein